MAVRVTAIASGTSNTAMVAFKMPGYRCRVYLAMLSRSPAGSGKCCASNSWYHRYKEWNPSFPSSSYLQASHSDMSCLSHPHSTAGCAEVKVQVLVICMCWQFITTQ